MTNTQKGGAGRSLEEQVAAQGKEIAQLRKELKKLRDSFYRHTKVASQIPRSITEDEDPSWYGENVY